MNISLVRPIENIQKSSRQINRETGYVKAPAPGEEPPDTPDEPDVPDANDILQGLGTHGLPSGSSSASG